MWKKEEGTSAASGSAAETPGTPPRRPATGSKEPATIGPSITIKGEVSGDEDLLIQGRIDGSVDLQDQSVTVGSEGRVKAGIRGRVVTVEGEVEGDLQAEEQVILRSSARVEGDITAPRVVLEDGARFRGLVDMGEQARSSSSRSADTGRDRKSGGASESEKGSDGSAKSSSSPSSSSSSSSSSSGGSKGKGSDGSEKAGTAAATS